jgi:hypothetical protein
LRRRSLPKTRGSGNEAPSEPEEEKPAEEARISDAGLAAASLMRERYGDKVR